MGQQNQSYADFFPYDVLRLGQEEMMERIDRAVRQSKHICCEAPNGFGKTSVTLSGILPWVKENDGKILYCARTHRQLDRVIEELSEVARKQDISGISLRGRRHMCLNPFVLENADALTPVSEVCRQLKADGKCAYYEKLQDAGEAEDLLADLQKKVLTAPSIVKLAKKRSICPYEFARRLAKVVDVLALSYLYVFDPWILDVTLPELGTSPSKIVLVQDEAHNVPATALDCASDSLPLNTVRQAMREATDYHDSRSRDFTKALSKIMLEEAGDIEKSGERVVDPLRMIEWSITSSGLTSQDDVLLYMKDLGLKIRRGLLRAGKFPRSAIHRVAEYLLRCTDLARREDYSFFLTSGLGLAGTRRISLDVAALDPTSVTSPVLGALHSSVAVSGTISPLRAYSEMLGFGPDSETATFRNPFAKRSRLCLVVNGLDTSYQNRGAGTYRRMVAHCVAVAHSTPGNTGIFAASYQVIKGLLGAGLEKELQVELFVESSKMKTAQNDKMIKEFKGFGENGGAVLLGVQGGRNSEGGDFPGSSMESVVVVGVPYAVPTPKVNAMIEYYDRRFSGKGRDYAYVLPAMTRAIQAAGRPVRRMDDRGVIVLLDQRFGTPYLQRFMPQWLREVMQSVADSPEVIEHYVRDFFMS
jgi:DNA excision repair protein ERCC-2